MYKLHTYKTNLMYTRNVHSHCGAYITFPKGYCNLLLHEYFYANHESKLHAKHLRSDQGSNRVITYARFIIHTIYIRSWSITYKVNMPAFLCVLYPCLRRVYRLHLAFGLCRCPHNTYKWIQQHKATKSLTTNGNKNKITKQST